MSNQNLTGQFSQSQEFLNKSAECAKLSLRLDVILEETSDLVWVFNEHFKITLASKSAKNVLGDSETINLVDGDGKPVDLPGILRVGRVDFFKEKEFTLNTPRLILPVKISALSLALTDGSKEYVVLVKDVSTARLAARLKEELLQIISHELRTPLTCVKDYLWLLKLGKGGDLPRPALAYLDKAWSGLASMSNLISRILKALDLEECHVAPKIEKLNLYDVISAAVKKFGGGRTNFVVNGEDRHLEIYADREMVEEVLGNFLSNALKFDASGTILVGVEKERGFVKVVVSDSGKGFGAEERDRLFKKFGRLDNSLVTVAEAAGTGLGLYISKMLVEKMSGQIGADSPGVGKGSTFWFTLPIAGSWGR